MFKPVRSLQVGCIAVLLAGCAANQTAAVAPAPMQVVPATAVTQNTAQPLSLPAPAPSIQAGISTPGSAVFRQANGDLTPNLQAYAREVANARGVPLSHVEALLRTANYDAAAVKLMTPSGNRIRRSWVTYRNRFVEPIRINAGERFWSENRSTLDSVATTYGVPPSIIVAIIGIETVYGRNTGSFRVLDVLTTLGFRYPDPSRPERSQLFRDQLADLIELDYKKQLNALEVSGSFAGAMGLPQFMPGSLMRYAADGDRDGRIDLLYSVDDAIASVARFLRLHGWVPGLPVFAPAAAGPNAASLVAGGLIPTYDWAQLEAAGATLRTPTAASTAALRPVSHASEAGAAAPWQQHKLGVVDLVDEPRKLAEYRIGTPNFFAITHYNRSYFYASSVADLAHALADRMGYGWPN
ncbi:lytic murein transglycosylase B [Pollutimonas thiosulfatoxidans]|uniref:Lytic murein transglycosylase B n=1 Tax=Pollutimonas thiosulfatoxidans TaxID=2028345 RepID=A0A410GBH4_9BURK|nr:lytic murein transglycosylase B [Pollutimonas thiosulfatoxidans]NYT46163.1 lytic murein transglycosylase B [Alcaligenaceae bacterium]QAA93645.1 lytic murein transglycosylase B [Pollutimonas thiosulfatoxidans]